MAKIAISGGIGAGKSTLANALRSQGYPVLDADVLAKNCLTSELVRDKILKRFPNFDELDESKFRKALASVVFSNREELAWLEDLIHPCVKAEIEKISHTLDADMLFVEVPVLSAIKEYDLIVIVQAPESLRISRLLKKGYDQIDILNRIESQPSQTEYSSVANFIFNGSLEEPEYTVAVSNLVSAIKENLYGKSS